MLPPSSDDRKCDGARSDATKRKNGPHVKIRRCPLWVDSRHVANRPRLCENSNRSSFWELQNAAGGDGEKPRGPARARDEALPHPSIPDCPTCKERASRAGPGASALPKLGYFSGGGMADE